MALDEYSPTLADLRARADAATRAMLERCQLAYWHLASTKALLRRADALLQQSIRLLSSLEGRDRLGPDGFRPVAPRVDDRLAGTPARPRLTRASPGST
jgi:hypothetical protein